MGLPRWVPVSQANTTHCWLSTSLTRTLYLSGFLHVHVGRAIYSWGLSRPLEVLSWKFILNIKPFSLPISLFPFLLLWLLGGHIRYRMYKAIYVHGSFVTGKPYAVSCVFYLGDLPLCGSTVLLDIRCLIYPFVVILNSHQQEEIIDFSCSALTFVSLKRKQLPLIFTQVMLKSLLRKDHIGIKFQTGLVTIASAYTILTCTTAICRRESSNSRWITFFEINISLYFLPVVRIGRLALLLPGSNLSLVLGHSAWWFSLFALSRPAYAEIEDSALYWSIVK
jgi:hypothetical protein